MKKYPDSSQEKWNQTFNIAGKEISAVLDIDESYAIAREKFELLRSHCIETLWINENPVYKEIMNHYLKNSWSYIMCPNFGKSTDEEIQEYQKDYILFISIISRITQLTKKQKLSFLKQIKNHHDTPQKITDKTQNPIEVMDQILSSI